MNGIIVTGTDTGIGKTVLAAGLAGALARRHGVARYWKPVQAGLEDMTDSQSIAALAPGVTIHPEAYRLITPASPHLAARIDGVVIDPVQLALPSGEGPLVVEGAGGALVPLIAPPEGAPLLYADMFARWGLPVVVAARTMLGTINHTLLTVEALRARGVKIAGIAYVGDENAETERVISAISGVPRLGRIPLLDDLNADTLAAAMAGFDWDALA
ncbi:ATP-dependent dethiobiotin synthetase BioD [Novosphingobium sp. FSY-8]|uniref:ATP-dependent dethiobiotin synthetase BioD n=1 Tax=Novosphingobium ovatum TaxID=1908523 RepID=A0ABW9XGB1_9SPHN|nr:dethiobiotin synthase [Novosphingobium ovatum]NBC37587.1 ATP-dependent dethiobiotin synthetase BioD [Novosphingobium ovatum]